MTTILLALMMAAADPKTAADPKDNVPVAETTALRIEKLILQKKLVETQAAQTWQQLGNAIEAEKLNACKQAKITDCSVYRYDEDHRSLVKMPPILGVQARPLTPTPAPSK
jgi:hypothetical protein